MMIAKQKRKSSRSQARLNYADLNEGKSAGDERIWGKLISVKSFARDKFKRYRAKDVSMQLLRSTGLKEPFVIEQNEPELEMKMPPSDITVHQIAELVGGDDYPVEVIDVASQSELPGWTMGRWAAYFHSQKRDRIRNVISLEISGSDLAKQITRPKIVRELDWIDLMWPTELHPDEFPRVQLYCLMGTKDSYTDFHIDFGGSSVFYHILSGEKTFYFIEPTPKNLKKYQKWSSSSEQSTTFLGDLVKECYSVHLKAGNTMIIPSGWIHAVYTPKDAIVIGGNFLHSFGVSTQLQVYEIEKVTDVPLKFQFPFYKRLNWYALVKFDTWLADKDKQDEFSFYELANMAILADFLRKDLMKGDTSLSKHDTISNSLKKSLHIPDTVSDPFGLTDRVLRLSKHIIATSDKIQLPSSIKPKKNKRPKLSIKLTTKPTKKEEDDFVEIEEEEDDDFKIEEDDDEEYYEDNEFKIEQDAIPVIHNHEKKKRSRTKKVHKESSSSDEEDSMGTGKKSNAVDPLSGLFSNRKRSTSTTSQKSTKQRILDRITKKY
ncbi:JmjC domain-containing histone demethylation protein 1 [Rhizopus stolonifer]|uniref:[histone H3]-dimethyl-L-lysine(36) demethylase n=1 Tax=Rhizopus stolonifer TaxID=4846 RepID=A0A367KBZ5_RHIST|nr:JmjC domain-containing histone demethylation protein 1 [Rhizopus stolonifer]